ncbi:MAG: hypothetical protein PQJ46_09185 [Spirochaetales bacterium]|nr:hypothetical protein [Spirochaetales bacterium]
MAAAATKGDASASETFSITVLAYWTKLVKYMFFQVSLIIFVFGNMKSIQQEIIYAKIFFTLE